MPLLFLNEWSCGTGCEPDRADRATTEFARTVVAVSRADAAGTVLVSEVPLKDLQVADGFPIGKWAGNPRNRDQWVRLRRVQDKAPFRKVFPGGKDPLDVEYRYGGRVAKGLGGAHLMDGLALSLPVDVCWDASLVRVERERLVETDEGETETETGEVDVRHLSVRGHLEGHLPWIRERVEWARTSRLAAVNRGEQLWERRAELFPRLQFLPQVEENLRELQPAWVRPVGERLTELDDAVAEWDPATQPAGPQWRSWVRPEHLQRRRQCWFTDFDGAEALFDLHCSFHPSPGRLHFRLVHEAGTVRVGYIGRKIGV